jgi:hypothetical protein
MEFNLYLYDEGNPDKLIQVGRVAQENQTDMDALHSLLGVKQIHDRAM